VALWCVGLVVFFGTLRRHARPQPGLLAASDSLYRATVRVAEALPKEVQGLRALVRPPVTYYLAGRVPLYPMAGSDSLLKGGDPRVWALVDSAILRSEAGATSADGNLLARFAKNWEVIEEIPTTPSLPTLLDLDPRAARSTTGDRTYPLWLLRPRTSKAPQ
jgi:dolichyl-phosphate-mannose-protein mannosyltransferase